jgi:hypothetical protein
MPELRFAPIMDSSLGLCDRDALRGLAPFLRFSSRASPLSPLVGSATTDKLLLTFSLCLACGGPWDGGSNPCKHPGSFEIRVTFSDRVSAVIWLTPNSIFEF